MVRVLRDGRLQWDACEIFKRLFQVLWLTWLLCFGSAVHAQIDSALQKGLSWLQMQIQPNGQLSAEATSPALPKQVRAEVATTFKTFSQPLPAALLTATEAAGGGTTEYLARNALSRQAHDSTDAAALDALILLQNTDGGFGAAAGLPSNSQDTAWALMALASNRAATPVATQALAWLKNQQVNGAWLLMPDGDSFVTTSLAAQAFNAYRQQPGGQVTRNLARTWLLGQRNTSQTWADDLRTAQALLAVIPGLTNVADAQSAMDALRNSQRADGSWGGDPYVTALALRALFLASQPIINPGTATSSLEVFVTDRSTHQPVANAFVYLSVLNADGMTFDVVLEAKTDAAGFARIIGIEPGRLALQVSPPPHSEYEVGSEYYIEFQAGINYSLSIPLWPYADFSGRIYGRVIDAETRQPIPGALVRAEGSDGFQHYTNTDASGSYELLNISVDPLWKHWNLSATAAGYMSSSNGYDFSANSNIDIPLHRIGSMPLNAGVLRTIAVRHPNSDYNYPMGHLFLFGPQGTAGSVVSNDGVVSIAFQIDASGVAEIRVPWTQYLNPSGQALNKASLVYASNPVDAYFLNMDGYGSSDMTYLLDVGALGTRYRIMTWSRVKSSYGSHLSFTALEDGTSVTVTPSTNITGHSSGATFSVQLNKGQSYIYESARDNDMTGTILESNKAISVFSGARCANIPVDADYCDHLFTQLPPVEHWASEYVIPKTANTGAAGNLVRILSDHDGNEISINGINVANLRAGEFYEYDPAGDFSIKSTHPVLVGQFMKGSTATTWGVLGDPAFTYIPGVKQAKRNYEFIAPAYGLVFRENYVNVAIINSALSSLRLNGAPMDTAVFRAIPGTEYSAGNVLVPTGPGEIRASVPFVATLSGFDRDISYHTFMGTSYSNGASGGLDPVLVRLDISTDKPVYPAGTDAWLAGAVVNYGNAAARLKLELRLIDTQGQVIAQFAAKELGDVAAGATISHTEVWNTGTRAAGAYTLIGTVLNEQDQVLDTASALLTITAGSGANAPKATLTVNSDKARYLPDDRVLIGNSLRNLIPNAALDDVRVVLKVFDPTAQLMFTHTHTVGQVPVDAVRTLEIPQFLKNATLGTYTVEATLIASGEGLKSLGTKAYDLNVKLAASSSQYEVTAAAGPGPQPVPGLGTPGLALAGLLIAIATGLARHRPPVSPFKKTQANGERR